MSKELIHINVDDEDIVIIERERERLRKLEELNISKAEIYRKVIKAGIKALGLTILLLLPTTAFAKMGSTPIDFGDSETQITILATYAFAHTTYQLLRKRAGMAKLPAWFISHVGAGALSLAHDQYADGSRGYISKSKQWGAIMSISLSTVLSIHLFDGEK